MCLSWIKRRFEPFNAWGNISQQFENFEIYKDLNMALKWGDSRREEMVTNKMKMGSKPKKILFEI